MNDENDKSGHILSLLFYADESVVVNEPTLFHYVNNTTRQYTVLQRSINLRIFTRFTGFVSRFLQNSHNTLD